MPLEFGLTNELTNTQLAPLAAIGYTYRQYSTLKRLSRWKFGCIG